MTKEQYLKRMQKHDEAFDKLWTKIVNDTNTFIQKNPTYTMYSFQNTKLERFIDSLCKSGAWIQDRINGKCGVPGMNNYKGSLTKKIRKALGYTY